MAIAESEVNGDAELDLAASKDVLQEAVPLVEVQVLKANRLVTTPACQLMLNLALAELRHIEAAIAQVDVLATLLRLKELKANLSLRVLVGQFRGEDRDEVPPKAAIDTALNLTLVDGLVVVRAHELVDKEEVVSILRREFAANIEVGLLIVASRLLIGDNLDVAALASGALVALNALLECLVGGSDNLVDGELNLSYEVMASIVACIVKVINIIDYDAIVFALLKVIWNFKVLNPLRIKVVHDHFSLA
jgi:hypothetical protein